MPVLVIGRLDTATGPRQVGLVTGISDNLYAFDVESGKILWQKHRDYPAPAGRGGGGGNAPQDPKRIGFLQPGDSSDTPAIGRADAQGRRPVYFVTGDGLLHTLNAADGSDLQPPFLFHRGKGWALNLVWNTLWMQTTYAGASIAAARLDDPQHTVMTWNAGSGGAWGRRGVAIDSEGTAWTTTGDGVYDPSSDPPRYANSVVGVHLVDRVMKLKGYYTPTNWEWLRKRDLDPNNTPTVFKYKGREIVAASGKECRLYLLDPKFPGGADSQTPAFKTPLFCNEEVDFQDMGSWPAVRFVDPCRQGHSRRHLRARRDDRQGAQVEWRSDAPVQSLLRRHRGQWSNLPGHLRWQPLLLRRGWQRLGNAVIPGSHRSRRHRKKMFSAGRRPGSYGLNVGTTGGLDRPRPACSGSPDVMCSV